VKYNRITSYIPEDTFAEVMTDLIVEEGRDYTIRQDPETKEYVFKEQKGEYEEDLAKGLKNMPESDLKRTLSMFHDQAEGDIDIFYMSVKHWYSEYMVRVNFTYGKKIKRPLLMIGICIAIFFNIDFFHISKRLWTDANLREGVVMAAESFHTNNPDMNTLELNKKFFKDYENSLDLPIGWGEEVKEVELKQKDYYKNNMMGRAGMVLAHYQEQESTWWLIIVKLFGFVLSAFIVSFGAPFWFDLLKKAISFKKIVKSNS